MVPVAPFTHHATVIPAAEKRNRYPLEAYALEHHKSDIAALAPMGSWQATKWLGPKAPTNAPTEQELADRCFFGDIGALRSLSVGSL